MFLLRQLKKRGMKIYDTCGKQKLRLIVSNESLLEKPICFLIGEMFIFSLRKSFFAKSRKLECPA